MLGKQTASTVLGRAQYVHL